MKVYGRENEMKDDMVGERGGANALLIGEALLAIILGLCLVMAVSSAVKFKANGMDNARRDAYCIQVPEVCR